MIRDVRSVISGSKEGGEAVRIVLVSMRSSNANEDGSRRSTGASIWHCEGEYCRRTLAWAAGCSTRLAAGRHVAWGGLKRHGSGKALHLQAGQLAYGQTAKRLEYRRYPRLKTDKPNDLIDEYGIPGG
ncbi:Uncharacterised protein [Salmonella enterica subsp. diarizonae]|uniref:Uncharacterized protein n=1 Tax=Salmonella diarizonae TaxID=59204 RepID=A0A379TZY5_SALDZ|nr:Uncharacterised protein [Salmonella enterica subsp. diarizonae]